MRLQWCRQIHNINFKLVKYQTVLIALYQEIVFCKRYLTSLQVYLFISLLLQHLAHMDQHFKLR